MSTVSGKRGQQIPIQTQTYPYVTEELSGKVPQAAHTNSISYDPASNPLFMQALSHYMAHLAQLRKVIEEYIEEHRQPEYHKQIFRQILIELKEEESKQAGKFKQFYVLNKGNTQLSLGDVIKIPSLVASNTQLKSLVAQINSDLKILAERTYNIANLQQFLGNEAPDSIATVDKAQLEKINFNIVPTPLFNSDAEKEYEDEDEADYYSRWEKDGFKDRINDNTIDVNGFNNRLLARSCIIPNKPVETLEDVKKVAAVTYMAFYEIDAKNKGENANQNMKRFVETVGNTAEPMMQSEMATVPSSFAPKSR